MLSLIIGTVGGGKSYEAVAFHVLPALKSGRKVITNLPLNIEAFKKLDNSYADLIELRPVTKENPRPFSDIEDYHSLWRSAEGLGALYVIDECHFSLPYKETQREVEEWFSMHRHESADVVLITQNYQKISKSIRDLTQTMYRVRKNVAFGSEKTYTRKAYDGIKGALLETKVRKYQKQFFQFYNSHTKGGKVEAIQRDYKSFWGHWVFKAIAVFICLFIWRLYNTDFSWLSKRGAKPLTPVVSVAPSQLPMASKVIEPKIITISGSDRKALVPKRELGDYPFKGSKFSIVSSMSVGDARGYIFEVLPDSDYSDYLTQLALVYGQGSTASAVAGVYTPPATRQQAPIVPPPAKRLFLRSSTLIAAGYNIRSLDACNVELIYSDGELFDRYFASCPIGNGALRF